MKKLILLLLSYIAFVNPTLAQEVKHCGTDQAIKQYFDAHPEMIQSFIDTENAYTATAAQKGIQSVAVYTIPVVFHVLHQSGPENISDAQIVDAINILNVDMRKLNADTISIIPRFKGLLSDIRIEFRLAQLDPNGNCTNGIDRIYTSKTNYGDDSAKVNPWPRDKYLNIWTAKALQQGWAGYAYYPSAATGSLAVHDGLMVLADYVGSIGTSSVYKSRTITHEVGHWLDLGHPWNRTINISINVGLACGDDLVNDTPITKGHVTCPDLYTPDCMVDTFSAGVFNFNAVTVSSGTTDPSLLPTIYDSLNVTPFQATGLSANSGVTGAFSFSGWPTGAVNGETNYSALTGTLNASKYYEVTVAPKYITSSMSLYGLKFKVNRNTTGPRTYAIRSSADGFTSNLTATLSASNPNLSVQAGNVFFYANDATTLETGTEIKLTGASFINKNIPVTFRIYAWNAEDNSGEFTIEDASIAGMTGVIENIQNHMEYSYCTHMFTTGQKDRMRLAVESAVSGRSNLWSPANLAATGITGPTTTCTPTPDFYVTRTRICKGNSVTFTKNILNGTETSRQWTFQGGTPATSTLANPNVTYNTPGTYSVSLTATNAAGTGTVTKTQYIRVDNTTADITNSGSYTEGFENSSILNYTWQSYDYDNNGYKWQYAANSGTGGSNCVRMSAYNNYGQDIDELMSPSFDLTTAQNKSFTFKVAAAATTTVSTMNDELKVFFSTNCGNTWLQRAVYTGTTLINNPASNTSFTTNAGTVWTLNSIPIIPLFQTNNVRIKFQYKSTLGGNNIYLDDVNISETVGIEENALNTFTFIIYPNPSNETATISYDLSYNATVNMKLYDVLGKLVYQTAPASQVAGNYKIPVSKREQNLSSGVYFVKLQVNDKVQTQKLIISE